MKKIIFYKQSQQSECGLCCIAMLSSYYGYVKSLNSYRLLFKTGRDGMSLFNMCKILNNIGIKTKVEKILTLTKHDFDERPSILFINENHYVVALKKVKNLYIYDPAIGKKKISEEELSSLNCLYLLKSDMDKDIFVKSIEKNSETKHLTKLFVSVSKLFTFVVLTSFFSYIISIWVPLIMRNMIDQLINTEQFNLQGTIISISLVIVGYLIVSVMRNFSVVKLQKKIVTNLSNTKIAHLLNINFSYFDERTSGGVLYRLNLVDQLQNLILNDLIQFIISITVFLVTFSYILLMYPYLILPLTVILAATILLTILFHKKVLAQKQSENQKYSNLNSLTTEIVRGIYQIKCLKLEKFFLLNYQNFFSEYKSDMITSQKMTMKYNLILNTIVIFSPIYMIILVFTSNHFTIGEVFALYSFITTLFNNCNTLAVSVFSFGTIRASLLYVNDFFDEPTKDIYDNQHIEKDFKRLTISNLTFRYNNSSEKILDGIYLNISSNEKVALVGSSGSGKSTLISLIAQIYEGYDGLIKVNGKQIQKINSDSLAKLISIVPQKMIYFHRTLRENLVMGQTDIADNEIYNALKSANIYDEISILPMKLDTLISESGNLSGGQLQRLSIARSLLKKPKFIIYDEATSSLDSFNSETIFANLAQLDIAQLVVTHQLESVKHFDRIYVIDNGKIVGQGTHEELKTKSTFYQKLMRSKEGEL
ncbi:peptidase domain-containing ABC transporter [Vagococcus entomophilus]|uniref:ABC transporter ATP-binding protein n=1 Tax=Vagococcus entomophilus TaxID=1160095 RepID=A0A430AK84_9ENTE|nr:peptidase domain-containing ABC transporter [Vagococcus entomophilus]RSU08327.1 hypothetical protein CBF30_03545 [Vagococcus entomophilus]